ncbi:MAG: response regulator transcription factor [Rhodoferax sp.]
MQVWRVLIVEDDPQMRSFFAASVERCGQLSLVASVASVAEAKDCLDNATQSVDVLLTDLGLPDGSGLQVIRHARTSHPDCEALVISMFGDEDNVLASIEAGALGYIHKDAAPDDIANTILEMKAGASPISPMIARRVLSKYRSMQTNIAPALVEAEQFAIKIEVNDSAKGLLSRREQEVLELVSRGFSYAEIADLKNLSVHTIQTHIKSLYGKLEVHSKLEAVLEATRMGLLPRQPVASASVMSK